MGYEFQDFFNQMKENLEYIYELLESLTTEQKKSLGATVYSIQGIIGIYTKDNWDTVQKLVDKEIPNKIKDHYHCPICTYDNYSDYDDYTYCAHCGQKLSWKNDDL